MTATSLAVAGCGTDANGGGSSSTGSASSTIQIWEGYTDTEAKEFAHLVSEYEAQHPGQKVDTLFVNNDDTLQKVLTAVKGGSPPDIAYLYGSWAPNVAQIPQVVNLTQVVQKSGVNWNDFYVGERDVASVNGKVIGIPALVDNLAVVYNKKLFAKAGLALPTANWTWQDFANDAQKLTDSSVKQYGTAYVTPGTEDTVWHWESLLWEAGGSLLTADNKQAAFNSAAGLQSLQTLQTMAVTDKSMYLDPTDSAYGNLFNSGKIGMLVTGPWDLGSFPNVDYGVQVMPSYPGTSAGHQTISGPDNWVVFNNGSGQVSAAEQFLLWLTAPAQVKAFSLATGDLPTRQSVADASGFDTQMNKMLPGVSTFISNLGNVKQARPQIATYPQVSKVLGNMVVSVLLGKATPQAALASAASQVNAALAAGS
ncbi:ABC transporter substrate-binding protein [Trebonia kvetii]|uniref:ABC transporter substrate-binding protein n=2 Tax=Trebonia kvetii TaxID=2480626 RepID=A0A6P2BUP7_9ACTN|nr:ABC transporter substrate-binding protein [Trebonia kvetii]